MQLCSITLPECVIIFVCFLAKISLSLGVPPGKAIDDVVNGAVAKVRDQGMRKLYNIYFILSHSCTGNSFFCCCW